MIGYGAEETVPVRHNFLDHDDKREHRAVRRGRKANKSQLKKVRAKKKEPHVTIEEEEEESSGRKK